MMPLSPARGRHGLTRDVLRTSVPEAGQPSQRADWARPSEPVEASRLRSPPRSVFCRVKNSYCTLTWVERCATIPLDPRFGTRIETKEGLVLGETTRYETQIGVTSSMVEGLETSQEPNGRTREEGSDLAAGPRCDPSKPRRDISQLASEHGPVRRLWHDLMPPRRAGSAYRPLASREMPRRSAAGRTSSLSASLSTVRRLGWRPPFS